MSESTFELRGMRDFYPEDMEKLRTMFQNWHKTSLRYGFSEWDGPILETQALYTAKSGEEIVQQLYAFTDKGNRDVAIRAEMTPTLARMLLKKMDSLPRPLKWYNIARCCRYERPSKGRLREFFQWNIDLLGEEQGIADAEVMATACDSLLQFGLTPADFTLRINDRRITTEFLSRIHIPNDQIDGIFAVIDKTKKVESDDLIKMFEEKGLNKPQIDPLMDFLSINHLDQAKDMATKYSLETFPLISDIMAAINSLGFAECSQYDPTIVRGLAYYTGAVFEVFTHSKKGITRAIAGGGRYDHLMEALGGSSLPACGFGMGDVVLGLFLEEQGLFTQSVSSLDYYLVRYSEEELPILLQHARKLRMSDKNVDYSIKPQSMAKQLKKADQAKAKFAIFFTPEELNQKQVRIKNLHDGKEELVSLQSL